MNEKRNLRGKALENYKKSLTLNHTQKDIIIGTLLGDSTMGLRNGQPFYGLKFEQSVRREKYINHLANEFDNFCGSPPQKRWIDKLKTRESIWFRTYRHDAFRFYFNLFYIIENHPITGKPFSRKIVPSNISKFFTPRAVAYWFMDDGTYHLYQGKKAYYFSTQGFTKQECIILSNALLTNFNISSNVHKDKDKFRISIRVSSNQTFRNLITPYLHSDFLYKL